MEHTGAAATCVPVQIDAGDWETAVFFQVGGPESKTDRRVLNSQAEPLQVSVEGNLIEHEHAAVVTLRLNVFTTNDDPLVGEVLIAPGYSESHFETLSLLTRQKRLCWFFSDRAYWVIHSQQNRWTEHERAGFKQVMADVTRHDALIRVTGRYDADAALRDIVSHYEIREGALRTEYQPNIRNRAKPSS